MNRLRFVAVVGLLLASGLVRPPAALALNPQQQWSPDPCLGVGDPFCAPTDTGSGGGGTTCTATSICRNQSGQESGSISCTGTICSRGTGWVKCNGNSSYCGVG